MPNSELMTRSIERPFKIEELFFSATDLKGLIRSGNEVFARISGYTDDELIGAPHNIIRHPDMPRCVFQLLWDEIEAGRPIAAYVKNRAKDGSYYWVMATVVPIEDGYLSVRLKPSTAYFEAAETLYRELVALEQSIEGPNVRDRKPAIEASTARLGELLADAGFDSYQTFMNIALPAEIQGRDEQLSASTHQRLGTIPAGANQTVVALLESSALVNDYVDQLLNLEAYIELGPKLTDKADYILGLSADVSLFSLNALLAAGRAGTAGAALSAVAELLRSNSERSGPTFKLIDESIGAVTGALRQILFVIAATKLQSEMAMVFAQELGADDSDHSADLRNMAGLSECILGNVDRLSVALDEVELHIREVNRHVAQLKRDLSLMRALEVNGRIEAVHVPQTSGIQNVFTSISEQIGTARDEVDDLLSTADVSFTADRRRADRIAREMSSFRTHLAELGASEAEAA
jgi:aerotaxis receptor